MADPLCTVCTPTAPDPFRLRQDPHLLIRGGNEMAAPLGFVVGFSQQPGLYVVGDPRTGLYQETAGSLSWSLDGRPGGRLTPGTIQWLSGGKRATLSASGITADRTYQMPNASGTLALSGVAPPYAVRATSISTVATLSDNIILGTAGVGGISVTLPTSDGSSVGHPLIIQKVDAAAGHLSIIGTVNGTAPDLTLQWDIITLIADGVGGWIKILRGGDDEANIPIDDGTF